MILPVIATKFTTNFRAGYGETEIMANFGGNGTKSMRTSVEASLKKLQTDYIDLVRLFSAPTPQPFIPANMTPSLYSSMSTGGTLPPPSPS